jgi:hypothetical protein
MNDSASFFWSLMFGAVGMGYFVYGKSQGRIMLLVTGALLCVFPYFVSDLLLTLVIGGALVILPFFTRGS